MTLFDHQHGEPFARQLAQQRKDLLGDDRRQADRRLVDQQHGRAQHERAGNLELLLLAAGQPRGLRSDAFGDARKTDQHFVHAQYLKN